MAAANGTVQHHNISTSEARVRRIIGTVLLSLSVVCTVLDLTATVQWVVWRSAVLIAAGLLVYRQGVVRI
eukprot:m.61987 g.61987  ORF g.61987 m.61987 type:complete len:70 (+) comp9589_c0_seq1:1632-1841(+)